MRRWKKGFSITWRISNCPINHAKSHLFVIRNMGIGFLCLAVYLIGLPLDLVAQEVEPGDINPVTPTARRLFFADHHGLMVMPRNPDTNETLITFTDWARSEDLQSLELQDAFENALQGITESHAAAGHILNEATEQVAVSRLTGSDVSNNTIQVDILTSEGDIETSAASEISGVYKTNRFQNVFNNVSLPNSFDIAVGDLSLLIDEDGNGHSEVAVCYPTGNVGSNTAPFQFVPLTVQVTVLDYTELADTGNVIQTTASAPVPISGDQDQQVKLLFLTASGTTITCTTGDVNGDGIDEVLLAYLVNDQELWVGVFQYTNDGDDPPTLEHVGTAATLPPVDNPETPDSSFCCPTFWGSVDLVSGDFNADGFMDIGVSSVQTKSNPNDLATYPVVSVLSVDLAFGVTWESSFSRFTQSISRILDFERGEGTYACRKDNQEFSLFLGTKFACTFPRTQIVSGLFKFHPPTGFDFDRRQLVVVWNIPGDSVGAILPTAFEISEDLKTLDPTGDLVIGTSGGQRFSVTSGGFIGAGNIDNPQWSILVSNWHATTPSSIGNSQGVFEAFWIQPQPVEENGEGGDLELVWNEVLLDGALTDGPMNSRLPAVAWDREGASLWLGASVRMTVYDLVRADYIIAEPPKHAYWWPPDAIEVAEGEIINISRQDDFFVELKDEENMDYSQTSRNITDWSIGGSVGVSAKQSTTVGPNAGIVKTTATQSVEVKGKVSYDYNENMAEYEKDYRSETRTFEGRTERDDLLVARLQTYDIWRYPISGVPLDEGLNPFWEISFPGQEVETSGGGLTYSWYTPSYENGNVLSYPGPDNNVYDPPDCCAEFSFIEDGKEVTKAIPFRDNRLLAVDGAGTTEIINFSQSSGEGETKTYNHNLSESIDVTVGYKTVVKTPTAKSRTEFSASVNLTEKASWSDMDTTDSSTNTSTGFTLSNPAGNVNTAYFFVPTFYLAKDGTTKVAHAVDVLGPNNTFWQETYGKLPDAAFKLPRRFSAIPKSGELGTFIYVPNLSDGAKQIRGFFTRLAEADDIGTFPVVAGAVTEGGRIRLEVDVNNYSVGQGLSNLPILFEAATYDSLSNTDGPRFPLQCEPTSTLQLNLNPLEYKRAVCVWDTTGFGPEIPGTVQTYRIWVTLDPNDEIQEIYEGTVGPGQNNEGWAIMSIAHSEETYLIPTRTTSLPQGGDVSLAPGALAEDAPEEGAMALQVEGTLESPLVRVTSGQRTPLRVCVKTNQTQTGNHHLLIYDGLPENGGRLLADELLAGIDQGGDTCTWLPNLRLEETDNSSLFARVLETGEDAKPGNAISLLGVQVDPRPVVEPSYDEGAATGLTSKNGRGRFEISGTFPYTGDLDLESSMMILGPVLNEPLGAGELIPGVEKLTGQDLVLFAKPLRHTVDQEIRALPLLDQFQQLNFFFHTSKPPLIAKLHRLLYAWLGLLEEIHHREKSPAVVFETLEGQEPRVQVEVRQQKEMLEVKIEVEEAQILQPERCGGNRVSKLTTFLSLMDQENPPVDLRFDKGRWACRVNARGEVTALRLPRG